MGLLIIAAGIGLVFSRRAALDSQVLFEAECRRWR
jgi:hypothetical protein